MKKRISLILLICMCFGMMPANVQAEERVLTGHTKETIGSVQLLTQSRTDNFNKSYSLGTDAAENIVAVAMAQYQKKGSQLGYTEDWCANFVSDCAKLAGQSSAIPAHSAVSVLYNNVTSKGGTVVSTPKVGDLAFMDWNKGKGYKHVEIVYQVSGNTIYTIGGNSGPNTSSIYTAQVWKHSLGLYSGYFTKFVRPKYVATIAPTLKVEGGTFPESIQQGTGYASSGKIVSNEKIRWAKIGVVDLATGNYVMHEECDPNATTYDISSSTRKLNTSSLKPGNYKFCVSAKTQSGLNKTNMIANNFKVEERKEIVFDMQGGTVKGSFAEYQVTNVNGERSAKSLVVYNNTNGLANTNTDGYEAIVNNKGQVTGFREYGDTKKVTVPTEGMVVSGQHVDNAACGSNFVLKLSKGNFVGFDNDAMKVYAYEDCDSYLIRHKNVNVNAQYGLLPVPMKAGYYFDGWYTQAEGGEKITYYSQYSVDKLYAHWTKEPVASESMTAGDHIYEVYDYSMSWEEAKAFCESRGGHLVTITSAEENEKVLALAQQGNRGHYWLGAESVDVQGKWNWVTGETFSYSNWDTQVAEGNTPSERFAVLISVTNPPNKQSGEWVDSENVHLGPTYYNYSNSGFICEYETSEGNATSFFDVKETDYFYNPVLWAVENQITSGKSATFFAPNEVSTRGDVVTFLWRAAGKPEPQNTENCFIDVQEGAYYYKAVLWAVEQGITSGTSATTFEPAAGCTRAQVVSFLWRLAGKVNPTLTANGFTDVSEGVYYENAVLWAVEQGITSGTSETTFGPNNACTRGQIVTFIYRSQR